MASAASKCIYLDANHLQCELMENKVFLPKEGALVGLISIAYLSS